jgi:hypothetical protein
VTSGAQAARYRTFTRDELVAAFAKFEQTVQDAAQTRDWERWVQQYTPDVDYIEPVAGTWKGRDEVRAWISATMSRFPGNHMTGFPTLWSVIDQPTARVICELDNPMADPGDGTVINATNLSILTYAGGGLWCRQEDVYNPLRFVAATMRWCRKAEQLGTLPDEAADWMRRHANRPADEAAR